MNLHFSFLCKRYAAFNNKFTTYINNNNKQYFELSPISSIFPGDCQKIDELFLSGIFNAVLLLDAILLFLNDVT